MIEVVNDKRFGKREVKAFSKLKNGFHNGTNCGKRTIVFSFESLKTYIRSTTDDTHFENLIVLHIHRNFTDKRNLQNIAILLKALNLVKNVL